MNYKVVLRRPEQEDQIIPCDSLSDAERTVENLKAAFPRAFRLGEMSATIVEE